MGRLCSWMGCGCCCWSCPIRRGGCRQTVQTLLIKPPHWLRTAVSSCCWSPRQVRHPNPLIDCARQCHHVAGVLVRCATRTPSLTAHGSGIMLLESSSGAPPEPPHWLRTAVASCCWSPRQVRYPNPLIDCARQCHHVAGVLVRCATRTPSLTAHGSVIMLLESSSGALPEPTHWLRTAVSSCCWSPRQVRYPNPLIDCARQWHHVAGVLVRCATRTPSLFTDYLCYMSQWDAGLRSVGLA